MTDIFIRIELRGDPSGDVYKQLHALMSGTKKWETVAIGEHGTITLPHAMYKGRTEMALMDLAKSLQQEIIGGIWSKGAIVLVIAWTAWAQAGGK